MNFTNERLDCRCECASKKEFKENEIWFCGHCGDEVANDTISRLSAYINELVEAGKAMAEKLPSEHAHVVFFDESDPCPTRSAFVSCTCPIPERREWDRVIDKGALYDW